jgi:RimJ/RimL family protein N-acetyltransferase
LKKKMVLTNKPRIEKLDLPGMKIATARLVLKPHTLENTSRLNEWENDPELIYLNDDQPEPYSTQSLEETHKYIQRHLEVGPNQQATHYAIHRRQDGLFIGYGMIAFIDRYNRSCRLGITIGDKSQWGQGYAREALLAVLQYCFHTLSLNRIGAEIYAFNTRSIVLFEKLGFKREGIIRQCVYKKGHFEDEHIYGLLREEWQGA